jgi:aminopeptidase N
MIRAMSKVVGALVLACCLVAQPLDAGAAGDRFYPTLGNNGYDVLRYELRLRWTPPSTGVPDGWIEGRVQVDAVATGELTQLSFDFSRANTTIERVILGGETVEPGTDALGRKLAITPPEPIAIGARFSVVVAWQAVPALVHRTADDEDVPVGPANGRGVVGDGDGGFFLAAQPNGAHVLFPSNDYPTDKALFTVHLTVPPGMIGVSTGQLVSQTPGLDGSTTWLYQSEHPVATHVLSVGVGRYSLIHSAGHDGLPLRYAVPTITAPIVGPRLAFIPDVIAWLEDRLVPYPFEAFGIHAYPSSASDAILEAQTMVLMPDQIFDPRLTSCAALGSVAHEAAHMWFGDSVSIVSWDEKWLAEGHATFYEWLWLADEGCPGSGFEELMESAYAGAQTVRDASGPPAVPFTPEDAYTQAIYGQGALALYALQQEVGEAVFEEIERVLLTRYADGNASTRQFIGLASEVSGRDLGAFLGAWLCGPIVPPMPGHPDWPTSEHATSGQPLPRSVC